VRVNGGEMRDSHGEDDDRPGHERPRLARKRTGATNEGRDHERRDNKRSQVSARRAGEHTDPRRPPGEHRQARCSDANVDELTETADPSADGSACQQNKQGLHRDGHGLQGDVDVGPQEGQGRKRDRACNAML